MNRNKRREEDEEAKRRIRRRVYTTIDEADYEYFPEKKQPGFYDNDIHQRVAVYARVSTGSVSQASSFELQISRRQPAPRRTKTDR